MCGARALQRTPLCSKGDVADYRAESALAHRMDVRAVLIAAICL
jgi:hypothetical protein